MTKKIAVSFGAITSKISFFLSLPDVCYSI